MIINQDIATRFPKIWAAIQENEELKAEFKELQLYIRNAGLQEAIEWHKRNQMLCERVSHDEPRLGLNANDRERARVAAAHHGAATAGLIMLLSKIREKDV